MYIEPNKTTIAIVAPYFPPEGGGLERYAKEIAKLLYIEHDYNVIVITSCMNCEKDSVIYEDGLTVYRLKSNFKISNTPFSFSWFWKIHRILRKEKPKIINIHMPVPGIGDVASLLAGRIPVVVTYHSGSMRKSSSKLNCLVTLYESIFLPLLLIKSKNIVCSSDFVRYNFLRKYEHKSLTITPAVDSEMFKPDYSKKTKYPSVLFVAGLNKAEQYKGLKNLIQAILEVRKIVPSIHLTIVGDGDMKEEYIKYVNKIGLGNSVIFKGRLIGNKLAEEYQKAHIFVQPSSNESFGMVVLEAMSSGLPSIMVKVGGAKEMIDDVKNGLLLESNDPVSIADKLLVLLSNQSLLIQMGKLAREKILLNYCWYNRSKEYTIIFNNILNKKFKFCNNLKKYKKIAIIGPSGSGKTTLSKKISSINKLPVFHIDDYIWISKWEYYPESEYLYKHSQLINSENWILEGYIDKRMSNRLVAADIIIYLDYSFSVYLYRYIKRWFEHRKIIKNNLNDDPLERFSLKLAFIMMKKMFTLSEKREIESIIKEVDPSMVIRVTSSKKLKKIIRENEINTENLSFSTV